MNLFRLIALLSQAAFAGVRTVGMGFARKVARFERTTFSRLADLPAGIIDFCVLGLYSISRSGKAFFPLMLTALLILLLFLLR